MAATPEERDRLTRVEVTLDHHVVESAARSSRIEAKLDALVAKVDALVKPPTPPEPPAPSGLGVGKALRWVGALLAGLGLGGATFADCAPEETTTAEAGR